MECPDCNKEFKSKFYFKKHIDGKICSRFYCLICKKQYRDTNALNVHKKSEMHKREEIKFNEGPEPKSEIEQLKKDNEELKSKIDLVLSLLVNPNSAPVTINNINNGIINNTNTTINITLPEIVIERESRKFSTYPEYLLQPKKLITSGTKEICVSNEGGRIEIDDDRKIITVNGIIQPISLVSKAIAVRLREICELANKLLDPDDDERFRLLTSMIYSFMNDDEKKESKIKDRDMAPKYQFKYKQYEKWALQAMPLRD